MWMNAGPEEREREREKPLHLHVCDHFENIPKLSDFSTQIIVFEMHSIRAFAIGLVQIPQSRPTCKIHI